MIALRWWLRSPLPTGNRSSNNFEVIMPTGERGYWGGAAAYGQVVTNGNSVAFGFDQRICSLLTAFLLVALSDA